MNKPMTRPGVNIKARTTELVPKELRRGALSIKLVKKVNPKVIENIKRINCNLEKFVLKVSTRQL